MNIQNKLYSLLAVPGILLALLLTLSITNVHAQTEQFIEGKHYELLGQVQPVQTGDKIEVVEMFWYGCPHCFRFEPYIIEWLETIPDNAQYVPIPATLSERWDFHAKAHYTFDALGLLDELHGKFFSALHAYKLNINTLPKLADWAAKNGVDRENFINNFNSFSVQNKFNYSNVMTRKYGISGVPSIVVDGRYRATVSTAGSNEQLIKLIDFLIEKAAIARAQ